MTKKFFTLIVCFLSLAISTIIAQSDSDYKVLKFEAHPKHQSELGISVGNFMVLGDILPQSSWGAGLHFRKAFDYAFSWRVDALYGVAKGLEPRNSGGPNSAAVANYVLNGSLNNGINYTTNDWYHNYQTKFMSLTLQGVWSLNSFNFKKQYRKTNIYIFGGLGVNSFKAYYDAKNSSGVQHDFDQISDNLDTNGSRADRKTAKERIKSILDGTYETRAEIASGRRNNNDPESFHINFHANTGVGVSFKVNENFNISIEQQMTFVFGNDADLLDGNRWRNSTNLTQNIDLASYTSISFNINIGKKEKRSEPLWWVSPLSLMAEDLAEVKARPVFDTTDSDNDGVVDMFDQEPDTPEGYAVDTKGIQLDSDGDGIADGNDKERYSAPGYNVDAEGIAQVPAPDYTNVDDVNRIFDETTSEYSRAADAASVSDWWLPMIHFNLNRYDIKDSEFGKLRTVAIVMQSNPNKKVVVIGHADQSSDNASDILSYNRANATINYLVDNYGISRDRLILNWSGKNDPLVDSNAGNEWNRRVEFRIATNEVEETRPDYSKNNNGDVATIETPTNGTSEDIMNNEGSIQIWKIGYDSIPSLIVGDFHSFCLEIRKGENAEFQYIGQTKKPIQKTFEVAEGDIILIEVDSPNDVFRIKSSQEERSYRKEFNTADNNYDIFKWDVIAGNNPGTHKIQLDIFTHPLGDDSSPNPIYTKKIPIEVLGEPVVVKGVNEEAMKLSSGLIIAILSLIIIVLIAVFVFVFLFYKRKEKQKAEEKEKVFPDTAIVFLEEVKHIIGDGETDVAIKKLLQYFDEQEKLRDELLQLRAQYQHYKSKQRIGLLEPSDDLTLNRINYAIIELINESKEKLAIN